MLSDFGHEGQSKIKSASVLLVGAGGLGCPAGHPSPPAPTSKTEALFILL